MNKQNTDWKGRGPRGIAGALSTRLGIFTKQGWLYRLGLALLRADTKAQDLKYRKALAPGIKWTRDFFRTVGKPLDWITDDVQLYDDLWAALDVLYPDDTDMVARMKRRYTTLGKHTQGYGPDAAMGKVARMYDLKYVQVMEKVADLISDKYLGPSRAMMAQYPDLPVIFHSGLLEDIRREAGRLMPSLEVKGPPISDVPYAWHMGSGALEGLGVDKAIEGSDRTAIQVWQNDTPTLEAVQPQSLADRMVQIATEGIEALAAGPPEGEGAMDKLVRENPMAGLGSMGVLAGQAFRLIPGAAELLEGARLSQAQARAEMARRAANPEKGTLDSDKGPTAEDLPRMLGVLMSLDAPSDKVGRQTIIDQASGLVITQHTFVVGDRPTSIKQVNDTPVVEGGSDEKEA